MGAIFITGTGTDVGKTFVTAALIRHLHAHGREVEAIKPIVSGFDPADAAASDTGVLLAALGCAVDAANIARISPWRFAAPLSPDLAARREGHTLDVEAVIDFSRRMAVACRGTLFIEGVGGIMVPLDEHHTVLDWMAALRLPLVLVAGSYLGTLSHTLTALAVLTQRKLDVAAVVVSESPASGASLEETVETIARFAGGRNVVGLPRSSDELSNRAALAGLAALL